MKNKINGIDVSECKNFSCGICEEENKIPRTIGHFTADCAFYPNCYFKQLQRLKKENEELKKQLEFSRTHKTVLDAERIKYKQGLEEIREVLMACLEFKTCVKCKFQEKCKWDVEEENFTNQKTPKP